ncbi:MAG TPA: PilZ domain-containing protein [Thermoanaerobaculia bacterium]|nr:PilZ domain-containing protein [Thermoanaerobaculia bacterium]
MVINVLSNEPTESMSADRRSQARHRINVPLALDGGAGTTIDMSAGGVLFETDQSPTVGSEISFTVFFIHAGSPVALRCSGPVVRVASENGRVTVAAAIDQIQMDNPESLASVVTEKERANA